MLAIAGPTLFGCGSQVDPAADVASMDAIDVIVSDVQSRDVSAFDAGFPYEDAMEASAPTSDALLSCGDAQPCSASDEYCQVIRGGTLPDGGTNDFYRCDPFIVCMSDHTCACLRMSLKCSMSCSQDSNGGITTVCGM